MKKIAFVLWALICPQLAFTPAFAQGPQRLCYTTNGTNCVPAVQASNSAAINISTATTTELVAAVSSKRIFVTTWDVIAGGTGNFTLVYGTGTNCGTGTTSLTGAYPLTAQAGIAKGNGLAVVFALPASNALCATTSQAVQMSGSISYAQF